MTIIDIPGLDTDRQIDDKIVKYCTEADIIILVINATLCIKGTIKKIINEFQTSFTKLNFFLVFNHCDQLDDEVDRDKVKDRLVEAVENVFHKELKYSINLAGDRTFFISARDQMRINGNEEYMKGNRNRESRSKEFNRLINKIKETVSIDGFQRRYKYLKELYDIVEQNIKECESLIFQVKEKITSAGKSTLISALLNRDDLPIKCGRTTNCFVEISLGDETCFMIEDEQRDIGTLKNFVTFTSQTRIQSGSHVDLYYTEEDCPFIRPNMVLIDIPGIDTDESIDQKTLSYCRGADLIVLVVNSTITLSNRIQRFVNDFKTIFSNLNIIIVYNHSDQLDDEDDPEINIAQLKKHANSFFKDVKNERPEYARKRTFFVSAKEEMAKGNTNNEVRKIEFAKFKKLLIGEISVSSIERRIRYLNELYTIIKNVIKESHDAINKLNNKISIISTNVVRQLKQIPNLNKAISHKISKTMDPLYDEFRECALREVRRERDGETKMKRVEDAVRSVLDRGLREIKQYITDKIRKKKNADCLRVIERMYFPEYLEKFFPSSETVREGQTFDLNLRTRKTAELAAGGVALGVAAAIATAGVAIPLAIGCVLFSILSGVSIGSITNDRNSNQDEHEIKIMWNEWVNSTKQSFSKFLEEINTKLPNYFAAEEQLRKLGEYEKKIAKLAQRFEELNEFY